MRCAGGIRIEERHIREGFLTAIGVIIMRRHPSQPSAWRVHKDKEEGQPPWARRESLCPPQRPSPSLLSHSALLYYYFSPSVVLVILLASGALPSPPNLGTLVHDSCLAFEPATRRLSGASPSHPFTLPATGEKAGIDLSPSSGVGGETRRPTVLSYSEPFVSPCTTRRGISALAAEHSGRPPAWAGPSLPPHHQRLPMVDRAGVPYQRLGD